MVTPEWDCKNLNAALASWAELKHDAILYAKQPMGAECGGAGPPDPVVKGYVEPNTAFWKKAIELLDNTHKLLKEQNMLTEKIANATQRISEEAQFLLRISEKELAGSSASVPRSRTSRLTLSASLTSTSWVGTTCRAPTAVWPW